jgi:hypothetical protein
VKPTPSATAIKPKVLRANHGLRPIRISGSAKAIIIHPPR